VEPLLRLLLAITQIAGTYFLSNFPCDQLMPTFSAMQIPAPTDWAEFEDIVLSAMRIRWTSTDLQKHGRSGQAQQGVDIFGSDDLGRFVGIQCKKSKDPIKEEEITAEIINAESFQPGIAAFYLVTSRELDAPLQRKVRLLSEDRVKQGKFPVKILFWDDIIKDLATNEAVFAKHYPQLAGAQRYVEVGFKLFALFDLVFYGKTLDHQANIIFGEWGQMAGVDSNNLFIYCSLIRNAALQLLSENNQKSIEAELTSYETIVRSIFTLQERKGEGYQDYNKRVNAEWRKSKVYADRIRNQLDVLRATFSGVALAVFELGSLLARWEVLEYNDERQPQPDMPGKFSDSQLANVQALTNKVAAEAKIKVEEMLDKYKTEEANRIHTPTDVFSVIHKALVMDELKMLS
jgi:hypothetical protein